MVRLKVLANALAPIAVHKFQFLMVRLKGSSLQYFLRFFIISIPYGAIKRLANALSPIAVHEFQFLMVRLKGW